MTSARSTIDIGIDLGTTNSAIALQDGLVSRLLSGQDGKPTIPSAVHFTAAGQAIVGADAIPLLKTDPENTIIEFKRMMGIKKEIPFPAAGKVCYPEYLSSLVLQALASRAPEEYKTNGQVLNTAVISVPAMFTLSACEATTRAAAMAGITYAPLIQEPIAAAIAHGKEEAKKSGYWLIFDFGGGTFDVSIVRAKDGKLLIIDHDGDNHLGGKDFDGLIARRFLAALVDLKKLQGIERTDSRYREVFKRLKHESERLKIQLSQAELATSKIETIDTTKGPIALDFELSLDRAELLSMVAPMFEQAIGLCKKVIARNQLQASDFNSIVLVGGPTLTHGLGELLEQALKIQATHLIDPLLIVAKGAAVYASTQKLPTAFRQATTRRPDHIQLEVEYPTITTNPSPMLIGKAVSENQMTIASVRVTNQTTFEKSDPITLGDQNTFVTTLSLRLHDLNLFSVEAFHDESETQLAASTQFRILHGMNIAPPPLSQSIGVMLADNSVVWYLRKGVPLPSKKTNTHTITMAVRRGSTAEAIHVPVVQGEDELGNRNKIIGVLKISADKLQADLQVGSTIEVTLSIDEFSQTRAVGHIPSLGQRFEEVIKLEVEAATEKELSASLQSQKERIMQLKALADSLDVAGEIDSKIGKIEALMQDGLEADTYETADAMLRTMIQHVDGMEKMHSLDILHGTVVNQISEIEEYVNDLPHFRESLDSLKVALEQAVLAGEKDAIDEVQENLSQFFREVWEEHLGYWLGWLNYFKETRASLPPDPLIDILLSDALQAHRNNDFEGLKRLVRELAQFLPQDMQNAKSLSNII